MVKQADTSELEVLRFLFYAIPREMGVIEKVTSNSPHLSEGYDYAAGISDGNGDLISQAEHVTLHLMAMESGVKAGVTKYGADGLRPGDVLVHNDPFTGGSHLPDIIVYKPVFYRDRLIAYSVSRAHHVDVGGMRSGYAGDSTEMYQEGIRIPVVKLYEEGLPNNDIFDLLLANVRLHRQVRGDYLAQVSACNCGEKRILDLVKKYGGSTVTEAMKKTIDYTEFRVRKVISQFPQCISEFEDFLDGDGAKPLKIKVKIEIKGDGISVDFAGSSQQVLQPINAPLSIAHAGTYIALMGLIDPDIQRNHGCFRPITVLAPEGSIINAKLPAPVAGGNTETCNRVINTIWGAMAQVVPQRVISSMSDGTFNVSLRGNDPATGRTYAFYQGGLTGGWGGRATKDGFHSLSIIGGDTSNTPIEIFELRHPWRVEEYRFVTDSGGPGKWRGGLSLEWRTHPIEHTAEITTNMSRIEMPPYGLFGGMPGLHTSLRIYRQVKYSHGDAKDLKGDKVDVYGGRIGGVKVGGDDLLFVSTAGGGGYGNPYERDPELVLSDVLEEYVSIDAARRDYGVVITSRMKVDKEATEKLRTELKSKNKRERLFVDQATPTYAATPFRQIKMSDLPQPVRQRVSESLKEVGHTITDEE